MWQEGPGLTSYREINCKFTTSIVHYYFVLRCGGVIDRMPNISLEDQRVDRFEATYRLVSAMWCSLFTPNENLLKWCSFFPSISAYKMGRSKKTHQEGNVISR